MFTHSFIQRWTLGLLPSLAIMNAAAMNMGVQISVQDPASIPLSIARSYGNCSKFLRTARLFPTAAVSFTIPPAMHEGALF